MQRSGYSKTHLKVHQFLVLKQLLGENRHSVYSLVTTLNEFVTIVKKLAKTQRGVSSFKQCFLHQIIFQEEQVILGLYRTSCHDKMFCTKTIEVVVSTCPSTILRLFSGYHPSLYYLFLTISFLYIHRICIDVLGATYLLLTLYFNSI